MKENTLNRDDVLGILRKRKAEYADAYGITAIGILGPFARGRQKRTVISMVVKMKSRTFSTWFISRKSWKVDVGPE